MSKWSGRRIGSQVFLWILVLAARTGLSCTHQVAGRSEDPGKHSAAGRLNVVYSNVKDPDYSRIHDLLEESEVLEKIVSGFNQSFALPSDLTIAFKECGEPNAFYDHDKKRITFCYEMIERLNDIFSGASESDEDLEDTTVGATAFMVYHELAHALLRIMNSPSAARTEDSVDQLSTFLMVRGESDAEAAALDGAMAFYDEDTDGSSDAERLPFWGDHGLNEERFDKIVCWVYGHDGESHSDLVDDGILTEARAASCGGEWKKISRTWAKLLGGIGQQ